jgi:hypothetical protein
MYEQICTSHCIQTSFLFLTATRSSEALEGAKSIIGANSPEISISRRPDIRADPVLTIVVTKFH